MTNDSSNTVSERVARQMLAFSRKLAAGSEQLARLGEPPAGCTRYESAFQFEGTGLRVYRPERTRRRLAPLVIVYALVNRPYMLDLEPERSFIRGLLRTGRTVYLVDWGYPAAKERTRTLEDYVVRHLDACLNEIMAMHGARKVDLLGVCQGGTMSLCHAALRPERIRTLTLMVTPIDFSVEDFLLARWLRYVDVDTMVERLGNVPGHLLNCAFLALKPMSLSSLKAMGLIELLDNPEELATFSRMEQWIQDSPDQAGRAFADFVHAFFRRNSLVHGGLILDGRPTSPEQVACPVLNVYASKDHIVPPSATTALRRFISKNRYTEKAFESGHIGIFASRRAASEVPAMIDRWLSARPQRANSKVSK